MPVEDRAVVGFSFGDSVAAVAIGQSHEDTKVIANALGERTTPTIIGYDEDQLNVGAPARG